MNKYAKIKSLYFAVLLIGSISCKKFIEIGPPKNQVITSTVFSDSLGATSAIIGMYTSLSPYIGFVFGTGAITAYTGLASDELTINNGLAEENQFFSNAIAINNSINNGNLWDLAYNTIYQANACLEGLAASNALSLSLKNQLRGEAKFVRAFIYFYLVNLYGEVPLVISTNYQINSQLPRASIDTVMHQIINDLTYAQNVLSENYGSQGKIRPNKYTALSLLARVYLYQKEWAQAENFSTQVIDSGTYSLEPDLDNVFLTTSHESIWQMPPYSLQGIETTEGYLFVPTDTTVIPTYTISQSLLSSFDSADQRKIKWLNKNTVSINGTPIDLYYPYKYKLGYDGSTSPLENYVVFRLAEQFLIRAEARVQQNNLQGALSDLNTIRNRANLPSVNLNYQSSILNSIQHERQTELFCEWGHRWFDLKRNGTIDSVLSKEKNNWSATEKLFPIPIQQIQINPNLSQNPGY